MNLFLSGGIMCFTCPVFNKEESGYKGKCESLEKEGKWTLVSNKEAEYYTPYSQMADTREKTGA